MGESGRGRPEEKGSLLKMREMVGSMAQLSCHMTRCVSCFPCCRGRVLDKKVEGFKLVHGVIGEVTVLGVACSDGHISMRWLSVKSSGWNQGRVISP